MPEGSLSMSAAESATFVPSTENTPFFLASLPLMPLSWNSYTSSMPVVPPLPCSSMLPKPNEPMRAPFALP